MGSLNDQEPRHQMGRKNNGRADNLRQLVANEAARLMDEHGIEDYGLAKRKAADRLGLTDRGSLPRNAEIEAALLERQRLFGGARHSDALLRLRQAARNAMIMFAKFEPRLAGPVLAGTAPETADVEIHLFAESPEMVSFQLLRDDIPHELTERRLRRDDEYINYPVYRFVAGDTPIEATVFPLLGLRQAPRSPVDGRPMRRASLREVESLLRD